MEERPNPEEARAALASVSATRAQLAALGPCPPWRHAAFGVVMALLVGGAGFELPVQVACMVVALGGTAFIVSYDRRRYGVFINGYRRGATRPVIAVLLVAILALLVAQIYFRDHGAAPWVRFAIGALAFVVAVVGSVIWSRTFRREMERGA
jgi:drug/metabolite transporter (DMT)-like permease